MGIFKIMAMFEHQRSESQSVTGFGILRLVLTPPTAGAFVFFQCFVFVGPSV
jgi:hypothetical protein